MRFSRCGWLPALRIVIVPWAGKRRGKAIAGVGFGDDAAGGRLCGRWSSGDVDRGELEAAYEFAEVAGAGADVDGEAGRGAGEDIDAAVEGRVREESGSGEAATMRTGPGC
jgi:hypothetical protein